ncbi:MAG TPA: BamA/TamA family outer membrane protein, partial [Tepidisphaeraceae bacterium]
MGVAAFGSTNGSAGLYGLIRDLRLGNQSRLFVDGNFDVTDFTENQEYVDGNPNFVGPAGGNKSNPNNFVVSETLSGIVDPTFKYLLPIGGAKDNPIATYTLDRGLLSHGETGGWSFNPFKSGRTYIEVEPFADWRQLRSRDQLIVLPQTDFDTFGLRGGIRWDNTDEPTNPSRGNLASFHISRDPGIFDSASTYTDLDFGYSQYINLGAIPGFRQSVVALDLWANDEVAGNAPYYAGATLGGYDRMRAYPFYRFSGRAAIYGSAELRFIPKWNPTKNWEALDKVARVDWIQIVPFVEVGRVANSFSTDIFNDLHIDGGIGLRVFTRHVLLRADVAASNEGATMWLIVGQSF